MQYVKQGVASEDMVQLFDSLGSPVVGLADTDVVVAILKEGETGYTLKALTPADWIDRGGGNYAIQFSAADFDTLGLFRYTVTAAVAGTFVGYLDALVVVEEVPSFPPLPPTINSQTDAPIGVTPDPVFRGDPLTINGAHLGGAIQVTIGGIPVPIVSNTDSQIVVTVLDPSVPLGLGLPVVVSTLGGDATATVDVTLDPADIPGDGCVSITGYVFDPETCLPSEGDAIWGRVLDQPNIVDGVGWKDKTYSTTTDGNGFFSINFPRNKKVEVIITSLNYRRVFMTPNVATADLFREIPSQAVC